MRYHWTVDVVKQKTFLSVLWNSISLENCTMGTNSRFMPLSIKRASKDAKIHMEVFSSSIEALSEKTYTWLPCSSPIGMVNHLHFLACLHLNCLLACLPAYLLALNWLIDWLIDWLLTDWLTDWLTDRLTDWLMDWLIGWLKANILLLK